MARGVKGTFRLDLEIAEFETGLGSSAQVSRLPHEEHILLEYTTGTADGSLDRAYSATGTATTTPTDVDLVGSLASVLSGATTSFVDIVGIVIVNTSTAGNLLVGGDANAIPIFAAANDVLVIPPGACFAWGFSALSGVTGTAETGDILQIAASAGSVTFRVTLVGRSA